jgi:hypothetical protein
MVMASEPTYTIADFDAVIHRGLNYTLPSVIIQRIQELKLVLFPGGVVPSAVPPAAPRRPRGSAAAASWKPEPAPVFQTTQFKPLHKTDFETLMTEVRGYLNKLTEKTYTKFKENIAAIFIEKIAGDDVRPFVQTVLDIMCTNVFLAPLNARLYAELVPLHDLFRELLIAKKDAYFSDFDNIQTLVLTDPRDIDRRKATGCFLRHVYAGGVLRLDELLARLQQWLFCIKRDCAMKERVAAIEEWSEALLLFLNECTPALLGAPDEWAALFADLIFISQQKSKGCPGLSSRIIFKFRDYVEGVAVINI